LVLEKALTFLTYIDFGSKSIRDKMEQEQSDEIEVLQSIFPDEFELVNQTPWIFKIHLVPNPGNQDNNHGNYFFFNSLSHCTINHPLAKILILLYYIYIVAVAVCVEFPTLYPSVKANVTIELEKGLTNKHQDELVILINKCSDDNIGSPAIFAITEVVKEWLLDNNVAGQDGSMYADMMRKQQQKDMEARKKADKAAAALAAELENRKDMEDPAEVERIRKRQAGHPVTLESFNAWKQKFEAEMNAMEQQGKSLSTIIIDSSKEDDRPTGKQLFLMNKAGREDLIIEEAEKEELVPLPEAGKKKSTTVASAATALGGADFEDEDDDDEDYVDGEDDDDDDDDDDYEEEG